MSEIPNSNFPLFKLTTFPRLLSRRSDLVFLRFSVFARKFSMTGSIQNFVTFDQNGQNAISAVSEFLAANLPNWRFRRNKNVIRTIGQIVKAKGFGNS